MLVLTRKPQEALVIDNGRVRICILGVVGSRVKLGVEAADDVRIVREELLSRDRRPVSARREEISDQAHAPSSNVA